MEQASLFFFEILFEHLEHAIGSLGRDRIIEGDQDAKVPARLIGSVVRTFQDQMHGSELAAESAGGQLAELPGAGGKLVYAV